MSSPPTDATRRGPAVPGRVLVMGAGSVGCYVGGHLAAANVPVTMVGRPRVMDTLRHRGLTLTDLRGGQRHVPPHLLHGVTELSAELALSLRPALVLLCVKSAATREAAASLQAVLPRGTPVLSLQNGVDNQAQAQAGAPDLHCLAGMVPFNVAELAPGHFHRGTSGELMAQDNPVLRPWLPVFAVAGLPLALRTDMPAVQWAKLLLNLNNPINALSGMPLREQLLNPGYRRVLADVMSEALAVLEAAGQPVARLTPLPAHWVPALLRLPTPLFRLAAARMLRMDAKARSSMADDLARARPTEIDALCGAVLRLAQRCGAAAPRNAALRNIVQRLTDFTQANAGTLSPVSPEDLRHSLDPAR